MTNRIFQSPTGPNGEDALRECLAAGRSESLEAIDMRWAKDAQTLYYVGVADTQARIEDKLREAYAHGFCAGVALSTFAVLLVVLWRM